MPLGPLSIAIHGMDSGTSALQVLEIAVKSPESRYSSSEYDLGALKACRYSRIVVIQIVVVSEVQCIQLDRTLLWAWKFCRYSRIVVISAVVISEVDCILL